MSEKHHMVGKWVVWSYQDKATMQYKNARGEVIDRFEEGYLVRLENPFPRMSGPQGVKADYPRKCILLPPGNVVDVLEGRGEALAKDVGIID